MTAPFEGLAALDAAVATGVLPAAGRVLLACSGGRDSMTMLHALRACARWTVGVATVDHGLHPSSTAHAEWVVEAARALGCAAWRLVADARLIAEGRGIEAGARAARYAALEAQAEAWGAAVIVVAHTADDQAETMLMRLGEGTGLRGLGGMRPRRGRIVRPWLSVTRAAVAAYAEAAGVRWVDDPSNADPRFRRNALRDAVSPGMAAVFGDGWAARAAATAARAEGALALLGWCIDDRGWVVERDDAIEVDRSALARLPVEARSAVVAHALRRAAERWAPGAGRRVALHVERLLEADAGAMMSLPGGLEARCAGAAISFAPRPVEVSPPTTIEVTAPGRWRWGRWALVVERLPTLPAGARGDFLACAAAPMPWRVRVAEPGDRFRALGAPGRRAVTRAWRDAGVPVAERRALPVIEAAGRLVWVGGLRGGEDVRAAPGEAVWRVELRPEWPPDQWPGDG